jgi:acyl carrier protein
VSEAEIKNAIIEGLTKVAPEGDPASLSPDENIRRTLDIDSYDFLNFLIDLHKRLGVEIPEADYGKLGTMKEMITYLAARTK